MFQEINTLRPFFEAPEREFSVREVARLLKITPATASKRLKSFRNAGVLAYRKERILDLYRADIENDGYRDAKLYFTLQKIRNLGLLGALDEFYVRPTVVLFGSAAKGIDLGSSDIDLVVISENSKEFPRRIEFEKKLGRNLHIFAVKRLSGLRNEHLMSSVINGIVLQGELVWI